LGLPAGLAVGFEQLPPALTLFPTHEKPEKLPDGAPQLIESSGMAKERADFEVFACEAGCSAPAGAAGRAGL